MAVSSTTMTTINPMPVSEKLMHDNHTLWKVHVLSVLRGALLLGFLDGRNPAPADKIKLKTQKDTTEDLEEVANPTFEVWKAKEQQVLSFLLTSVSRDVLVQVAPLSSASEVWKHIETSFGSQSHARVIHTRMTLATTQKGSSTIVEYFSKMKTLADEMASIGKKLDDKELCF
jgi:hypothetical protein